MEPIVGIDLGTTNSEVAFIMDGNAEILLDPRNDPDGGILPSCVSVDDDGNLTVGVEARNQAVVNPENTVMSIKRRMGEDVSIPLGEASYKPQEISALILRALKMRAEQALSRSVSKAVITVPAYFTDDGRQATREAGRIAGLEVVRIINEPTAAALSYETGTKEAERVLVYDLGGGTFDVSIVRIESGVVEVMASTGDNQLGGDDFDRQVAEFLAGQIEEEHGVAVKEDPLVMHRLTRAAETAKIALSTAPFVTIEEDHIASGQEGPIHLCHEMSRLQFEAMIEPHLLRTMDAVSRALEDAGLHPADLDKIILVGGSTRIPAIARLLEEKTGILPRSEVDPDLCVALGAALQAGREMGMDGAGVLIDITPYTFGTSALGHLNGGTYEHCFVPLIRRNTKLPASRSEAFQTVQNRQKAVEINVFQGESPDALENVKIGTYLFELTPAPAGSVITMRFDLDVNGILQVEALEKATGRTINAVIENAISRFSEAQVAAASERVNRLFASPPEQDEAPAPIPAGLQEIIQRAEAILPSAPSEDRDEIINLIEDLRTAADEGRMSDAENAGEEIEEILFYLE